MKTKLRLSKHCTEKGRQSEIIKMKRNKSYLNCYISAPRHLFNICPIEKQHVGVLIPGSVRKMRIAHRNYFAAHSRARNVKKVQRENIIRIKCSLKT